MKKILVFAVVVLLIILVFSWWNKSPEATWQGSYYKHGQQENEVYGPIFTNFNGCKAWALGKIVYDDDTANCSKNCHDALGDGTPVCEEVVRNWAPLPGSYTFDNYEE